MSKIGRCLFAGCLLVFVFLVGCFGGFAVDRLIFVRSLRPEPVALVTPSPASNEEPGETASPTEPGPTASPLTDTPTAPSTASPTEAIGAPVSDSINLDLISEAWDIIQNHYVDREAIKPHDLTYAAISGMVNALGDTGHSSFLTPEEIKTMNTQLQGHYAGVGIAINLVDDQIVVVTVFDDSPALKAGIKSGQIIRKVDGVDITGLNLYEVIDKVRGPAGTQVVLTIYDPTTKKSTEVSLTRAVITIHNVTWAMLPGTSLAYIHITTEAEGVAVDLRNALLDIQKQNATGIVLDLRNNNGGLVDQAISVVSQFKEKGLVLKEKDVAGNITAIDVRPGGLATQTPIVVLTNPFTISAGEIIAAALQDGGRAKLVGQTTFGTGTVLTSFPLSDGSEVLLAIQEWLTPAGDSFWHKGLAPDIEVALPDGANPLTVVDLKAMSADQLKASQDLQLLKGIEVLTEAAK